MKRLKSGSAVSGILVLICIVCTSCHAALSENTSAINSEGEPITEASVQTDAPEQSDAVSNFSDSAFAVTGSYGCAQSSLPWLRTFCSAQFGNPAYAFRYPREIFHIELYETDASRASQRDELYFLQKHFSNVEFKDLNTAVHSGATAEGKDFYYYKTENLDPAEATFYCALRVSDFHVFCFEYTGEEAYLEPIFNAVSIEPMAESLPPETEPDVKLSDTLTLRVFEPLYVSDAEAQGANMDSEIQVMLPNGWKDFFLSVPGRKPRAYCAEFGYPNLYTYKQYEHCTYQAFESSWIYCMESDLPALQRAYDLFFVLENTKTGTTKSGKAYTLNYEEIPLYHAIEYRGYIQIADGYVYAFMLCVDSDAADLIDTVMDSMMLKEK